MKKWMIAFVFVMLLASASAEIILSQPQSLYSFGDELDLDVTLKPSSSSSDFLEVNLYCGEEYELYRNYFDLDSGEEAQANVGFLFGNSLDIEEEECYLKAVFEDEEIESQRFEVSRKINLGVETAKKVYDPGEEIEISGTARKVSGDSVDGFVDLDVEPLGLSFNGLVTDGKFDLKFVIPGNHSGEQNLKFTIYEKDNNGEITNKGELSKDIVLRSVLKGVRILLDEDEISPGESVKYKVELVDQSGNVMQGDLAVGIFKPNGYNVVQEVRQSGDVLDFSTEPNYTSGYWKIQATSQDIESVELIYINEKESLEFEIVDGELIVYNSGNVDFAGPIEISIGATKDIMQISLSVGESKRYDLEAPDGDYQIAVKKGEEEHSFGAVSLTGNAIKIGEVRDGLNFVGGSMVVWIFLVLVLGLVVMLFVYRKKFMTAIRSRRSPETQSESVISSGKELEAGFLMLRMDDDPDITRKVMDKAREHGAGFNYDGSHKTILFSPHLTKKKENLLDAVRVASEIREVIEERNKKFVTQINYGIGVGLGNIIAERNGDKLKFISRGNAVSATKRIANEARGQVLVSEAVKNKLLGKVKFEKLADKDLWTLKGISDRSKHDAFLKGFVNRHKDDKKD